MVGSGAHTCKCLAAVSVVMDARVSRDQTKTKIAVKDVNISIWCEETSQEETNIIRYENGDRHVIIQSRGRSVRCDVNINCLISSISSTWKFAGVS